MSDYKIVITPKVQNDFDDFAIYCREYSSDFWFEQSEALDEVITQKIANYPQIFAIFYITGKPYRAYLFTVGKRTKYWIVYRIIKKSKTIQILRFWNASQNPLEFKVN